MYGTAIVASLGFIFLPVTTSDLTGGRPGEAKIPQLGPRSLGSRNRLFRGPPGELHVDMDPTWSNTIKEI